MTPLPDDPIVDYELVRWENDQWVVVLNDKRSRVDGAGRRMSKEDGNLYGIKGWLPMQVHEDGAPFGIFYLGHYYPMFW